MARRARLGLRRRRKQRNYNNTHGNFAAAAWRSTASLSSAE